MSTISGPAPCTPRRRNPSIDREDWISSGTPPRWLRPADIAAKPWFAVGGIDTDTLDSVLEAGARRICVGRAITQADDPEAAARVLGDRLRAAWKSDPAMERYTFAAAATPARDR